MIANEYLTGNRLRIFELGLKHLGMSSKMMDNDVWNESELK